MQLTLRSVVIALVLALVATSGVPPNRAHAIDLAFQAVRDAIIHLGLGDASRLRLDRWLGTGFLIDEDCMVMTAKHVIEGAGVATAQWDRTASEQFASDYD